MIKRTLLTGLLYLAMCYTFLYLLGCFVQWEIIVIPPINEWTNEERTTLFFFYVSLCAVAFMVEIELKEKKERLLSSAAEDVAQDIKKRTRL